MKRGSCPKCASTEIIQRVEVWGDSFRTTREHPVQLCTYEDPSALLFKGARTSDMTAHVCARCGFVELYANSPAALAVDNAFDDDDAAGTDS